MKEAFSIIKNKVDLFFGKVFNSKAFEIFTKYIAWGLSFVLLVFSLAFPLVTLGNGANYSLFSFLALSGGKNPQLIYISVINVICAVVAVVGLVFYVVEEFIRKNKTRNYLINKIFGIALFVLCFALLVTLLCYKSGIEEALIDSGFMLNQLGFAFYALFFAILILAVGFFRRGKLAVSYMILIVLAVVWIFPLLYIVLTSFRTGGFYTDSFFPEEWTVEPYVRLFTDTSIFMFGKWFLNTLIVAASTCVLSTFIIVTISFVLSRFNFKSKKALMSSILVLGMFPGFMSMIAIYYIIKGLGLSESLFALILCYSGGSAMGYYVVKGFMDTIPKDIDEAAMIDGASKLQIFFKMILPLSKPIIIYTILTSFMSPWGDYIFASVIMGDNYESYTVALGLYMMLKNDYINSWYTSFAAGAVIVALPISILFISLNKYYVEGLSGSVKG